MGYRLTAVENEHVKAIAAELGSFRPGFAAIDAVLPRIHALLATDRVVVLSPVMRTDQWTLERLHTCGFSDVPRAHATITQFFREAPRRYAWYDAANPEPTQRNRLVEAHVLIKPGELERSLIFQRWLYPARLHAHRQPRVLLCEGSTLLAWFGAFHDGPVEERHRALLRRMIEPMRRRLALERRLDIAGQAMLSLEVALEQIGAPAWLVDDRAAIRDCNDAARALLASRGREIREALGAARAGSPSPFELIAIDVPGLPSWCLAVWREHRDARIASAVAAAARCWELSAKQARVLEHLVRGNANVTIALELGVSERAIELHVSKLLERASVPNRSALVAAVLMSHGGEHDGDQRGTAVDAGAIEEGGDVQLDRSLDTA